MSPSPSSTGIRRSYFFHTEQEERVFFFRDKKTSFTRRDLPLAIVSGNYSPVYYSGVRSAAAHVAPPPRPLLSNAKGLFIYLFIFIFYFSIRLINSNGRRLFHAVFHSHFSIRFPKTNLLEIIALFHPVVYPHKTRRAVRRRSCRIAPANAARVNTHARD